MFLSVMATMNKPQYIKQIEGLLKGLIEKYEMTVGGELIAADIHSWAVESFNVHGRSYEQVRVVFEDEGISSLLAGYVSHKVYDELEAAFKALNLGYDWVDSDGEVMILDRI